MKSGFNDEVYQKSITNSKARTRALTFERTNRFDYTRVATETLVIEAVSHDDLPTDDLAEDLAEKCDWTRADGSDDANGVYEDEDGQKWRYECTETSTTDFVEAALGNWKATDSRPLADEGGDENAL